MTGMLDCPAPPVPQSGQMVRPLIADHCLEETLSVSPNPEILVGPGLRCLSVFYRPLGELTILEFRRTLIASSYRQIWSGLQRTNGLHHATSAAHQKRGELVHVQVPSQHLPSHLAKTA